MRQSVDGLVVHGFKVRSEPPASMALPRGDLAKVMLAMGCFNGKRESEEDRAVEGKCRYMTHKTPPLAECLFHSAPAPSVILRVVDIRLKALKTMCHPRQIIRHVLCVLLCVLCLCFSVFCFFFLLFL